MTLLLREIGKVGVTGLSREKFTMGNKKNKTPPMTFNAINGWVFDTQGKQQKNQYQIPYKALRDIHHSTMTFSFESFLEKITESFCPLFIFPTKVFKMINFAASYTLCEMTEDLTTQN